jgi:hypothetical protein
MLRVLKVVGRKMTNIERKVMNDYNDGNITCIIFDFIGFDNGGDGSRGGTSDASASSATQ